MRCYCLSSSSTIVRNDGMVMHSYSGFGHYIETVPAVINTTRVFGEKGVTWVICDSTISFLDNGIRYNNNNNHKSPIHQLDLAQGLIQLPVENKFTLKSLLNTSPSELSKTLGIDQEVATLICKAAKNKKPLN
jgi:hypothetical protein